MVIIESGFLKFFRVVGEVALTGNHCWVSFNNIFSGEVGSNLVSEVSFLIIIDDLNKQIDYD